MSMRIAVLDPLPLFRHGVVTALREAGLGGESPVDVVEWLGGQQRSLVVMSLISAEDWTALSRLWAVGREVLVLALLPDDAVAGYVRAFRAGATAALPRHCEPHVVRTAAEAAIAGRVELPTDVIRALTSSDFPVEPYEPSLTAQELDWLSTLASGHKVADVAEQAGYSERMMFRILGDLYRRMGAANRTEALLLARTQGWL